ncbi:4202_t:CDS:2, partial [Gigaspora margarita]
PASAYHTYLEEIQLKYKNDDEILADRVICSHKYDIYYLYEKFLNISVASLDILNILLTIILTNTPVGGLPLATILTLNETTQTFTKALGALKNMLALDAFGEHGPTIRPQVIMTNDCSAKKN